MINALTMAFEHYLSVPFEQFTDKYISALGVLSMIDDFEDSDKKIMTFIESNTTESIKVSIYTLDRTINPTKGEFKTVKNKIKFRRDGVESEFSEGQVQRFLCLAIRKVHEIVMVNMKNYKLERSLGSYQQNDNIKIDEGVFDV